MSSFSPHQFRDDLTNDIHRRMFRRRHRSGAFGVIAGTAVLLAGILFLLENFGLVHADRVWRFWPVIVIAWGISRATIGRRAIGRVWGGVVAAAGVVLLLGSLNIIREDIWRILWPLAVIGVGLRMLYRAARRRHLREQDPPPAPGAAAPGRKSEPGHLDEWAVFGGSRRRVDSQDFKGGEAFAMFGGVELDLRSATITQDEVVIDASALFGGVDIQVPEKWNVDVEGHGIFGGYEDKTTHSTPEDARPRVVITGHAIFGGVVVKN